MDKPIINSFLDTDFYKFTMGQMVFSEFPNVPVTYALKNRTSGVPLAEIIDEGQLREELDHVRTLRLDRAGRHYLDGTYEYGNRMFTEKYLTSLTELTFPEYNLEKAGGQFKLEFSGPWSTAIYWEIQAIAIINELYYRALTKNYSRLDREARRAEGLKRLQEKIQDLKRISWITFSDFGTRRRYAGWWQEEVVGFLVEELGATGQFLGTSNVNLAREFNLMPLGTSAHEMFMALAGIRSSSDESIRYSHVETLDIQYKYYGSALSIALTDTYGSDFFFRDFDPNRARVWKGLRQDSGDPMIFARKAIDYYKKNDINPKEKLIVFSDGLDVQAIKALAIGLQGNIKTTFGWGTNLTNDLGLAPLSLVIKLSQVDGHGTVKLSDNLAKAMGTPEDIERFKKIFGYTGKSYQACTY